VRSWGSDTENKNRVNGGEKRREREGRCRTPWTHTALTTTITPQLDKERHNSKKRLEPSRIRIPSTETRIFRQPWGKELRSRLVRRGTGREGCRVVWAGGLGALNHDGSRNLLEDITLGLVVFLHDSSHLSRSFNDRDSGVRLDKSIEVEFKSFLRPNRGRGGGGVEVVRRRRSRSRRRHRGEGLDGGGAAQGRQHGRNVGNRRPDRVEEGSVLGDLRGNILEGLLLVSLVLFDFGELVNDFLV